ncbi:(2Fe-2S)-binding protein [Agrobacterium rhizogenes]|nr:(2Fe-2S)-binding protein [Rhizobium rhizogenes]NTG95404.1 (2Fe-2S)-binding protein [Rhizobium rhizogenes]
MRRPSLREPDVRRGTPVHFTFDGNPVDAYAGESVAAALLAAGYRTLRESLNEHAPRGAFCWMGLCQECTVEVNGVRMPACRTECADGLIVRKGTIA